MLETSTIDLLQQPILWSIIVCNTSNFYEKIDLVDSKIALKDWL